MSKPLTIDYYTDILCVWAWIAQRRIDELNKKLQGRIEIQHYYMDIFGDVPGKVRTQWADKGGYGGFTEHVTQAVSNFEDAPVSSKVWGDVRPKTSANAHLMLKAVEIACGKEASIKMALKFREAFFVSALDIGDLQLLYDLVQASGLDLEGVRSCVCSGSAMAALMHDYQTAQSQRIKGSPSYVIDGGRQILYGNVGYRVLLANIEEVLKNPAGEASWC